MAKLAVWSWLATVDLRGPTKRQLSVGSAVRHPFLCATWPIGPSHKWPEWPVQRGVPRPLLLGPWGDHDIKMQAVPAKQEKRWMNQLMIQHHDINMMIIFMGVWMTETHIFHFGPHEPFKNTPIATIDRKIKGFLRFCFDWFPSAALWIANYTNPGSQFHPYPKK